MIPPMPPRPALVRELAEAEGFDLVRFGPAEPGEDAARFLRWLDAGRHGEMDYLHRNRAAIADPQTWRPGVRSTIALAMDYGGPAGHLAGGQGQIARYAVGRDYHRHLGNRVTRLRDRLEREGLPRGSSGGGTDALPVLERALHHRAGIGFLAKSAMVISPTHGPYLLLAELLTPWELPADGPAPGSCGTCTACLQACPTGAITAPFEVDARRCLSYTTIELRGPVPRDMRQAQGDRFFGCDVCLEVCPFTRKSPRLPVAGAGRPADLRPHPVLEAFTLVDVLALDDATYAAQWTGTAMRRATRAGLRRNAATVLGNLGAPDALPALTRALDDPDPTLRAHAAWAIGRIEPRSAALDAARSRETEPTVREEIEAAQAQRR